MLKIIILRIQISTQMGSKPSTSSNSKAGLGNKFKVTSVKEIDSIFVNLSYTLSNAYRTCQFVQSLKKDNYTLPKGLSLTSTVEFINRVKACPGRLELFVKVLESSEKQVKAIWKTYKGSPEGLQEQDISDSIQSNLQTLKGYKEFIKKNIKLARLGIIKLENSIKMRLL